MEKDAWKMHVIRINSELIDSIVDTMEQHRHNILTGLEYGFVFLRKHRRDNHYPTSFYRSSDKREEACLLSGEIQFRKIEDYPDQSSKRKTTKNSEQKSIFHKGVWKKNQTVKSEHRKVIGILLASYLYEAKYTQIRLADGRMHVLDDSDEVIEYLAKCHKNWAKDYFELRKSLKEIKKQKELAEKARQSSRSDSQVQTASAEGGDQRASAEEEKAEKKKLRGVCVEIEVSGRWDCCDMIRKDDRDSFNARFLVGNWAIEDKSALSDAEISSRFLETVWNTWRISFHGGDLWTNKNLLTKVKQYFASGGKCEKLRRTILDKALRYPLMNHLESRGRYPELYTMLLSMTQIDIHTEGEELAVSLEVAPPARTVESIVMRSVEQMSRNQKYSVYELLERLSRIASLAVEDPNLGHIIRNERVRECTDYPDLEDTAKLAAKLAANPIDKHVWSLLVQADGYYKMAGKELRLFLDAWGKARSAYNANQAVEKIAEELLKSTQSESLQEESRPEHYAEQLYSSESFYAYSYISALPEPQRYALLSAIAAHMRKNTDAKQRPQQELCLSILSYYLVEDIRLPQQLRDELFFSAYSKTLYKPQALMFDRLALYPCYTGYAKEVFDLACDPALYGTEREGRVVAPYFNFLQGALYSDEEIRALPPEKQKMIECCRLQYDTWHMKNDAAFARLDEAWLQRALELTRFCSDNLPSLYEKNAAVASRESLCCVFGLNMALYALTNLGIREGPLLPLVKNALEDSDWLYEALLKGDYWQRKYASQHGNHVYLIAGAARFVCEYGSRGWLRHKNILPQQILRGDFANWLSDLLADGDLRSYFILIRFLSILGLDPKKQGFHTNPEQDGHRRLFDRTNFLPYDHIRNYEDYLRQLGAAD